MPDNNSTLVPLREAALRLGVSCGWLYAQAQLGYVTAARSGRGGRRLLFDERLLAMETRALAALSPQRTGLAGVGETARFLGVTPAELRALAAARLVPSYACGRRLLFDTVEVSSAIHSRGGDVTRLVTNIAAADRREGGAGRG